MHLTLQPHWEGASIHLSVCNWDLLRCLVPSPALCIVLSLLPVLDLLWNPYMVISFSNAFGTGNNFQRQPLLPKKKKNEWNAPLQGNSSSTRTSRRKRCPGFPFIGLPSQRTPFAISALNLIYIHFIIFAFLLPQHSPALPCPALPASLRTDLWQSPLVVFLLFRVALMNSNVCVIELLKFQWTAPACLPACLPSVPTRFLRGVQAKISLWISQHFYIFVYFNLWPSAVQFISTASANGVKMKHDRRVHSVDSAYPVESCDGTPLYPTLRSVLSNRTAMQAGLQLLQQNAKKS